MQATPLKPAATQTRQPRTAATRQPRRSHRHNNSSRHGPRLAESSRGRHQANPPTWGTTRKHGPGPNRRHQRKDRGVPLRSKGRPWHLAPQPWRGSRPRTMPPQLLIGADCYLHYRVLPHGAWAAAILHHSSTHAPQYFSNPAEPTFCTNKAAAQNTMANTPPVALGQARVNPGQVANVCHHGAAPAGPESGGDTRGARASCYSSKEAPTCGSTSRTWAPRPSSTTTTGCAAGWWDGGETPRTSDEEDDDGREEEHRDEGDPSSFMQGRLHPPGGNRPNSDVVPPGCEAMAMVRRTLRRLIAALAQTTAAELQQQVETTLLLFDPPAPGDVAEGPRAPKRSRYTNAFGEVIRQLRLLGGLAA